MSSRHLSGHWGVAASETKSPPHGADNLRGEKDNKLHVRYLYPLCLDLLQ